MRELLLWRHFYTYDKCQGNKALFLLIKCLKMKHWKSFLLALFINSFASLYYLVQSTKHMVSFSKLKQLFTS